MQELLRLYGDSQIQQILHNRIQESEGRLLTEGEVNERISWVKVCGIPPGEDCERMRKRLERLDKKPAKWHVVVDSDPDSITFAQMRDQITFTTFIDRIEPTDDSEGWKQLIDSAVKPDSAIMIGPNPMERPFKRVLAKAIVIGRLEHKKGLGFVFKDSRDEDVTLGRDFSAVYDRLRHDYPSLVFIESTFARNLVVAEEQTIEKLHELSKGLTSKESHPDACLSLMDRTAVTECLTQAELLLPRLRRFRKLNPQRPPL